MPSVIDYSIRIVVIGLGRRKSGDSNSVERAVSCAVARLVWVGSEKGRMGNMAAVVASRLVFHIIQISNPVYIIHIRIGYLGRHTRFLRIPPFFISSRLDIDAGIGC
jgi:hypothetical protein